MRGHVRKRGNTWSYIIELGNQKAQRCDCGARYWLERKPLESCPECGGALRELVERRQREQGGFGREKDAQTALNTVLNQLQQGNYVNPATAKMSLRDYLVDVWLPSVRHDVKPSTYLSYETHVGRHIIPAVGSIPLNKLTGATLKDFYNRLLTEARKPVEQPKRRKQPTEKLETPPREEAPEPKPPLSRLTVRKIHATLHKALADAVDNEEIALARNPADAGKPPKQAKNTRQMKTWTAKELQAFLTSVKGTRLYPLWLTLASTGMRRGEALGLRWEDVKFAESCLWIRQNMVSVGYKVQIGTPKADSTRNVKLDPGTLAELKAFRTLQKKERRSVRKEAAPYVDTGYVFVQENGQPYHPDLVTQAFQKAVKDSGQPRIRLHDLRHTHATLALQAGIHPKVVQERLGHADIKITLGTYSHAIPAMEQEAATKIAALFMPS